MKIIYNVKVKGISVGLTFNKKEAEGWANASREATIEAREYKEPQEGEKHEA
jgi:hypothetical protein